MTDDEWWMISDNWSRVISVEWELMTDDEWWMISDEL
jgi:hypothetical protein